MKPLVFKLRRTIIAAPHSSEETFNDVFIHAYAVILADHNLVAIRIEFMAHFYLAEIPVDTAVAMEQSLAMA